MKIAKTILFCLFSVFLMYQSYQITDQVLHAKSGFSPKESIFVAFLLNLYLTGIFAFPGFVLPTNKLFPQTYYTIKNGAVLNKTYHMLRVDLFQKFLLVFFWGHKKNRKKFFNGTKSGLENFIYQTKQSEFGHLNAFLLILIISLLILFKGYWQIVIVATLLNVFFNFYPVVLQRYHRMRIARIIPS